MGGHMWETYDSHPEVWTPRQDPRGRCGGRHDVVASTVVLGRLVDHDRSVVTLFGELASSARCQSPFWSSLLEGYVQYEPNITCPPLSVANAHGCRDRPYTNRAGCCRTTKEPLSEKNANTQW